MEFLLFNLLVVYLVPFIVGAGRAHPQLPLILALNITLGWTGVGWIAALVWALSGTESSREAPSAPGSRPIPARWTSRRPLGGVSRPPPDSEPLRLVHSRS